MDQYKGQRKVRIKEFLLRNNKADSKAKQLEYVHRHITKHEIINDELDSPITELQKKKLQIEFIIDEGKPIIASSLKSKIK